MLIAECVRPCPVGFQIKKYTITVIDTDDGIRETEVSKKIYDTGLDVFGLEAKGVKYIIGKIYPIVSYQYYEIEDTLFIFKYDEVFAIRGNDSYMHVTIKNNKVQVNGVVIASAECLGVPSRSSLDSEFTVNSYYNYAFVKSIPLDQYIEENGVRSRIMRSILLS